MGRLLGSKNGVYPPPKCHPERKHKALGLCNSCYRADLNSRRDPDDVRAEARRGSKRRQVTASWRNGWLKREFGISQADYERMSKEQSGLCAICGKPPLKRRLAVDHCHTTGAVRGLLCIFCNTTLGRLENTKWTTKANDYLKRYRAEK